MDAKACSRRPPTGFPGGRRDAEERGLLSGLRLRGCGGVVLGVKPSQFALEHLAGARERKRFGPYVDAARTFVAGNPLLAERDDLRGIDLGTGLRNHEGVDGLAPLRAGNADHGAL